MQMGEHQSTQKIVKWPKIYHGKLMDEFGCDLLKNTYRRCCKNNIVDI